MKGRSGGRNKKPVSDHVFAGTFRRDRHGKKAPVPVPLVAPAHLDPDTTAVFDELARQFSSEDHVALELGAVHLRLHRRIADRLREADECKAAGETVEAKYVNAMIRHLRAEAAIVRTCLAGLTPHTPHGEGDDWIERWLTGNEARRGRPPQ